MEERLKSTENHKLNLNEKNCKRRLGTEDNNSRFRELE